MCTLADDELNFKVSQLFSPTFVSLAHWLVVLADSLRHTVEETFHEPFRFVYVCVMRKKKQQNQISNATRLIFS